MNREKPSLQTKTVEKPGASENSSSSSSFAGSQHWVQCENPDCLKWRILTRESMDDLDVEKQWFCEMNPNILYSSCETPEEKYKSSNSMKKHGFTYTFSLLPEGSLVWAKLTGYCKWPSVVCCEPGSPEYCVLDTDGDPHSYHVEFLGTRHSIAWVHHTKIDAYGNLGKDEALETCSQPLSQMSMSRFYGGKKKSRKRRVQPKKKTSFLAKQLQAAIDEADAMLGTTDVERLKNCTYRFGTGEKVKDISTAVPPVKKIPTSTTKKALGRPKKVMSRSKKRKAPVNNEPDKENADPSSSQSSQQLLKLSQNKLKDFPSKEERLMADIKGLQSLEQEFVDDYAKFKHKKASQIAGPHWQGVSVSLFQLYMAVQEKGGFDEVCANMMWKEVVMECCDIVYSMKSSAASTAMSYYSRHILPYEMHIRTCGSAQGTPVAKKLKKTGARTETSKKVRLKRDAKEEKEKRKKQKKAAIANVDEENALRELEEMENLLNEFEQAKGGERAERVENDPEMHPKEKIRMLEREGDVTFHFTDDSQVVKKANVQYKNLFGDSQQMSQEKVGVDASDLFNIDTTQSQVVPQVVDMDDVKGSERREQASEEDLFAELENLNDELDQFLEIAMD